MYIVILSNDVCSLLLPFLIRVSVTALFWSLHYFGHCLPLGFFGSLLPFLSLLSLFLIIYCVGSVNKFVSSVCVNCYGRFGSCVVWSVVLIIMVISVRTLV